MSAALIGSTLGWPRECWAVCRAATVAPVDSTLFAVLASAVATHYTQDAAIAQHSTAHIHVITQMQLGHRCVDNIDSTAIHSPAPRTATTLRLDWAPSLTPYLEANSAWIVDLTKPVDSRASADSVTLSAVSCSGTTAKDIILCDVGHTASNTLSHSHSLTLSS